MKNNSVLFGVALLALVSGSCQKEEERTFYKYTASLTDAPGPYSAVYVDIQGLEVVGADGQAVQMAVNQGIYNLLDYSNGEDTLFAAGMMEDAQVEQIRLILGPNNSIVLDSVTYPLSTPSADQSGLKLQVHQTLLAGVVYEVLLDFDANKSIVETGAGQFKLKPVIRTIEVALSGSIKGKISPVGTLAAVTATTSTTSYSSNVNSNGDFVIMGLPPGIYELEVAPMAPLTEVVLTNISVTIGQTTNVGTIVI